MLLLPGIAQARRPGAFNDDLLFIYIWFITVCVALVYGGKFIQFIQRKLTAHE